MSTMYDSVTAGDIPASATMVAGYVDGRFAWSDADWARFPNATKIRIAVSYLTNDGDVLDVEDGDATPAQARTWILMRNASGLPVPTIYCAKSVMSQVQAACGDCTYDIWVADWTGRAHLVDGSAATQWADPSLGSGGHYDVSMVVDWWPRTAVSDTAGLVTALAYESDTLGDHITRLANELRALATDADTIVAEMQRVRTQFIGARP
jgi:hypothetical protein